MTGENDNKTAKNAKSDERHILLIGFDGVQILDITGPSSVFARANEFVPGSYKITIASLDGETMTSNCGVTISNVAKLSRLRAKIDTIIVAGGTEQALRNVIETGLLPSWLQKHVLKVPRIGSVCTGAFILAAIGLFDNKRAVTHWASCDLLKSLRPDVDVDRDAIFIRDGHTFSSAGVTAAIDTALALVEEDLGRRVAADVAKSMVMFLRRPSGQSQYSASLSAETRGSSRFGELDEWISQHLDHDLTISTLAEKCSMSERNFVRVFHQEMGQTPASFIRLKRLEAACHWLETTSWPIKRIAERAGYGSQDSLERALRKEKGTTPSAWRHAYGLSRTSKH